MKRKSLFITALIIIQALISIKADINTDIGVEVLLEKSDSDLPHQDTYEQILDKTNLTEKPQQTQSEGIQEFNAISETSAERVVFEEDSASKIDDEVPVSVVEESKLDVAAEIGLAPIVEGELETELAEVVVVVAEPAVLIEEPVAAAEPTVQVEEPAVLVDEPTAAVVVVVVEEPIVQIEEPIVVVEKPVVIVEREELIKETLLVKEEINNVHDNTLETNSEGFFKTKLESDNKIVDVELDEDDDNHEDDAMKEVSYIGLEELLEKSDLDLPQQNTVTNK
jgi:hypothetical protein